MISSCDYYRKADAKPPIVNMGQSKTQMPNLPVRQVELSKWWLSLGDEQLSAIIEDGLKQNFDMQLALAKLKETRAILDINNYALGPQGNVGASAHAIRQSEKGMLPIDKIPILSRDLTLFHYGYDASWEVDVFGGLRSAVDGADALLISSEYQTNGVRITIAAEIARVYYELMGAKREKEQIIAYLDNLNQSIELVRKNVNAGNLSHRELDDLLAKKESFATQIPQIDAKINAAKIGLATLCGKNPNDFDYLLNSPSKAPKLFAFPIGANSELLQRRPDIRAAEARLQMRASEVEYYKAEHFPKFKINAQAGWDSRNPLDLFNSNSQALTIGPSISWHIFDGGIVEAQVNSAKARQDQAIIEYKKSVLSAISDTERALSDYKNTIDAINVRAKIMDEQEHLLAHQKLRFAKGDISKIEVLDAERAIKETKLGDIKTQTQAANSMIALFKALGGGWESETIK